MKNKIIVFGFITIIFLLSNVEIKGKTGKDFKIIPSPNSIEVVSGHFYAAGAEFHITTEADDLTLKTITEFAERLSFDSGKKSKLYRGGEEIGFIFIKADNFSKEEYEIEISKYAVKVRSSSFEGFFYAIQTLKQMLPVAIFGTVPDPNAKWELPCCKISDSPRFSYRGTLLDVSRHYFTVEEIKKIIDIMSVYKKNILHWHITDDQGWRIEIKKYPLLTEIGSKRLYTQKLEGRNTSDGIPYGGFYTQEEIKDIVRYAAERAITIIPEIDMPGHLISAMAAYPYLGCSGKSIEFGKEYSVRTCWGIAKDVLCVGKETSYDFIYDVLDEVLELFPSEYIHLGGDECPTDSWEKCLDCQRLIKEAGLKASASHSAENYLQTYFTAKMEKYLNDRGRRIIGWDEILTDKLSKSTTVMSWTGESNGIIAAKNGHDVVMTPYTYMYLNCRNTNDIENEPYGPHYTPIHTVYNYEPCTPDMTPAQTKHIIGVQDCLWTEWIATPEHLEYMMLPRLAAAAEVQWCNPARKNYPHFKAKLPYHAKIYEVKGLTYCKGYMGLSGMPGKERPIIPTSDAEKLGDVRAVKD